MLFEKTAFFPLDLGFYEMGQISDLIKLKAEAVAQWCSVKKVFLKISLNSPENTCARVSFLIKLQACS